MLNYPAIDPIALKLGPLSIHWYGLMYLFGFISAWAVMQYRVKHLPLGFTREQVSDVLFYAVLGIIIGGRCGYMFFYARPELFANPLLIFQIWKGGMSFHGGLIGVIISLWVYGRKVGRPLVDITDLAAPAVPLGLAFGRIGNFINSELWGRITDVPWAMIFPNGGPLPRHPSQLYEFFFEGIVLFFIMWIYAAKMRPRYAISGLFLLCYGIFRFTIEFFREPDTQIGYLALGWVTEGQVLSFPMIVLGVSMLIWAYRREKKPCNNI